MSPRPGSVRPEAPKYRVTTWDIDKRRFTPQIGVRSGPLTWNGMRRALRQLQEIGYECHREDPSVLVERLPTRPAGKRKRR